VLGPAELFKMQRRITNNLTVSQGQNGQHTLVVQVVYRGHGYGPFKYLNRQTFPVRKSHIFAASEGETVRVEIQGFERKDVPLEQKPTISFRESR